MAATFYAQVLRGFDWEWAKEQCVYQAADSYQELIKDGHTIDAEGYVSPCWGLGGSDLLYGRCFLGTAMALAPSGKYWTFWARSNVSNAEADRDSRWFAALRKAAQKHGGWIENGEGDPCDLFFGRPVEPGEFLEEDNG
jgi:hypothetical protein